MFLVKQIGYLWDSALNSIFRWTHNILLSWIFHTHILKLYSFAHNTFACDNFFLLHSIQLIIINRFIAFSDAFHRLTATGLGRVHKPSARSRTLLLHTFPPAFLGLPLLRLLTVDVDHSTYFFNILGKRILV